MADAASPLDQLIYGYRTVKTGGVEVVSRPALNFTSGVAVSDNSVSQTTDVTITAGGSNAWKDPVRAVAITALPTCIYSAGVLTAVAMGALPAQDGVTLVAGESLLVSAQVTTLQNGIYSVTQVGSASAPWILTRRIDADATGKLLAGSRVAISEGTVNATKQWRLETTGTVTIGTTAQSWVVESVTVPVVAGSAPCGRHTTLHSPIALWQLNGSLADTSGNGFTLGLSAGTTRYTDVAPSLRGARFDGLSGFVVTQNALRLIGDMTFEAIISLDNQASAMGIVACGAAGETLADNYLYSVFTGAGGGLDYQSESGAGVNSNYSIVDSLPTGQPCHYAMVRSGNQVTHYLNGVRLGATSVGVAAPATSGAPVQKVYLGVNVSSGFLVGGMSSVKIIGSALTAAQVQAESDLTIGKTFGR